MVRKILTHILTLFLLLLVAMPAEAGTVTWKQFQLASGYSPRALPKNPEKGTYSDGYTTIDYKLIVCSIMVIGKENTCTILV